MCIHTAFTAFEDLARSSGPDIAVKLALKQMYEISTISAAEMYSAYITDQDTDDGFDAVLKKVSIGSSLNLHLGIYVSSLWIDRLGDLDVLWTFIVESHHLVASWFELQHIKKKHNYTSLQRQMENILLTYT